MDKRELRKMLERAGLSQSEAARQLDITDRTMRRYVSGDAPIPRVVEYALLHLIEKLKRRS